MTWNKKRVRIDQGRRDKGKTTIYLPLLVEGAARVAGVVGETTGESPPQSALGKE
jgi:hypothetical protein